MLDMWWGGTPSYNSYLVELKHDSQKNNDQQFQQQQLALQQKAFDRQSQLLDSLQGSLGKYLSGNVGYDPTQLALLNSQFLNSNTNNFNQARSGVYSALASRGAGGGTSPVGGNFARGLSGLYGAQASNLSSGLANIQLSNLQQALTNKFNAGSILSGNAATLNSPISSFGSGATAAMNAYNQLAFAPSFGTSFGQGLGGMLGGGLGAIGIGGLSQGLGKLSSLFG